MGKAKSIIENIRNFFSQAHNELSILRDKISAFQTEIDALERRPIDLATAETKLKEGIAEIARRCTEDRFRQMPFLNELSPPDSLGLCFRGVSQFQLMCFFTPELVEEKMQPVLAEFLERSPGIAPDERSGKLAELRTLLRQLETQEEELVTESQKVGLRIPRRPDADPSVILSS